MKFGMDEQALRTNSTHTICICRYVLLYGSNSVLSVLALIHAYMPFCVCTYVLVVSPSLYISFFREKMCVHVAHSKQRFQMSKSEYIFRFSFLEMESKRVCVWVRLCVKQCQSCFEYKYQRTHALTNTNTSICQRIRFFFHSTNRTNQANTHTQASTNIN